MDKSIKNNGDNLKDYVIDFDLIDNKHASNRVKKENHLYPEFEKVVKDLDFDKPRFYAPYVD